MALNDTFLKACRCEPTDYVPVWFMRQAGRSLPGYRKMRAKYDVLTLTRTPELAAEVSLEPVRLLGVDAAILFADIMLLPIAMGIDLEIVSDVGPVIAEPINAPEDIAKLLPFRAEAIGYLQQTIRILRGELSVPLIGFAGAPFTLASYLIEGRPSRTWTKTKRFMYEHPEAWNRLMAALTDAAIAYLRVQVTAGAQALQLFDSWVGCLSARDYRRSVLPHVQRIFHELRSEGVPLIHFGTDTAAILADFSGVEADVIGLDWRVDLAEALKVVPADKAVQGNLEPALLLAGEGPLLRGADELLRAAAGRAGYIFNLGHGVPPEADDRVLKNLVDYVHAN